MYAWWYVSIENTYLDVFKRMHVLGSSRDGAIRRAYDNAESLWGWNPLDVHLIAVDHERDLVAAREELGACGV